MQDSISVPSFQLNVPLGSAAPNLSGRPGPYAPAYPAYPDATSGYGLLPWCHISLFADNKKAENNNFKIAVKIKFEIFSLKHLIARFPVSYI